jgi:short-subunit dehydrogenase
MNIIVTGASSGIGYEIVKQFAQNEGYKILAIARRADLLEKLKNECASLKGNVNIYPVDLVSINSKDLQKVIQDHFHHINILVNNAGTLINKPFIELSEKDISEMLDGNVISTVKMIQTSVPFMYSINSHIVNIGSMSGFQGSVKFNGLSLYGASKAAITSLTESLSEEFAQVGVKVNCLALGAVKTDMLKKAFPNYKAIVTSSQMATFIVDFSLNGNRYFNGKVIPVSLSTP